VSLRELGDLPLTPLVREVLTDAGYIGESASPRADPPESQMPSLFPLAIAGATATFLCDASAERGGAEATTASVPAGVAAF